MMATRTVKRRENKDEPQVFLVTPQCSQPVSEAVPAPDDMPTSRRRREELLTFAGIWSDLDADRMIEELYAARHDSPPSPPVSPASTATGKAS